MEGRRIYVKHPSYYADTFQHSGRKGMHWGERLYQYPDGSLTPLGRIHYGVGAARKADSDHVKREQNEDGTLTLRGMIKYKTTDKYKLMTDDDLRKQANRLQLQKNVEQLKKDTSASYRLKSKLENAAEEAIVSGSRRAAEKVINNLVDKKLSEYFDRETIEAGKKAIETARKTVESMPISEINARNQRMEAEKKYVERVTGQKLPSDYKFTDLPEKDKKGVEKASRNNPNNQQETPSKSENSQSSENKSEEQKVPEENKASETKSFEKKSEEKKSDKTKSGATVTIKRDKTPEKKSESKNDNSSGNEISASNISTMKAMKRQGQTIQQIALVMKVSPSTVEKYLKG